jgi:hypothetical protein
MQIREGWTTATGCWGQEIAHGNTIYGTVWFHLCIKHARDFKSAERAVTEEQL